MCGYAVRTTRQSNWRLGAIALQNGVAKEWMCMPTASMKMQARDRLTRACCCSNCAVTRSWRDHRDFCRRVLWRFVPDIHWNEMRAWGPAAGHVFFATPEL